MPVSDDFLAMSLKMFQHYKSLGEGTLKQVNDQEIHYRPNDASNNISILVKHLSGNMLSRFTDFLTTDGEKEWRNRDDEFLDTFRDKKELMVAWDKGWGCLIGVVKSLRPEDLSRTIFIRKEAHSVLDALMRQLTHYAAHVGQIMYLGKIIKSTDWNYLSIPPGESKGAKGNFLK